MTVPENPPAIDVAEELMNALEWMNASNFPDLVTEAPGSAYSSVKAAIITALTVEFGSYEFGRLVYQTALRDGVSLGSAVEPARNKVVSDAVDLATQAGTEAGEAKATWVFDGNTIGATYKRVLQGLDDGDPEVLDALPMCDLSGQWADVPTATDVALDALNEYSVDGRDLFGETHWPEIRDEIADAYEQAYNEAMEFEVARVARLQLED